MESEPERVKSIPSGGTKQRGSGASGIVGGMLSRQQFKRTGVRLCNKGQKRFWLRCCSNPQKRSVATDKTKKTLFPLQTAGVAPGEGSEAQQSSPPSFQCLPGKARKLEGGRKSERKKSRRRRRRRRRRRSSFMNVAAWHPPSPPPRDRRRDARRRSVGTAPRRCTCAPGMTRGAACCC